MMFAKLGSDAGGFPLTYNVSTTGSAYDGRRVQMMKSRSNHAWIFNEWRTGSQCGRQFKKKNVY